MDMHEITYAYQVIFFPDLFGCIYGMLMHSYFFTLVCQHFISAKQLLFSAPFMSSFMSVGVAQGGP